MRRAELFEKVYRLVQISFPNCGVRTILAEFKQQQALLNAGQHFEQLFLNGFQNQA